MTWVLTAYLVSASVFTPIIGRVGDKVGKERMLVVALAALAVGSLLAAVASTVGVLIAARVIQGIGGGVLPLTFGIIRDEFPREKVASAIGTAAALLAVGGGVGLVIAGPLVEALSYHWLFWIPMVITTVAAIAAAIWVPESPERTPGRINVGTALLMSAWLVALLVAVSQGHHWGWDSPAVIGLFVIAAVLLPVWVIAEARSSEPLVDMRMMRIPTVWTVNLVALLFGIGMYSMLRVPPAVPADPRGRRLRLRRHRHRVRSAAAAADGRQLHRRRRRRPAGGPLRLQAAARRSAPGSPRSARSASPSPTTSSG